ncbi:MAG: hypothetical protein JXQ97_09795 [Natronospirillum sp.]
MTKYLKYPLLLTLLTCVFSTASALPNLSLKSVVLDPDFLNFDPTGEIIFPSLLKVSDHVANPLGNYYLYYSPHDAPGGIAIAYADNIEGPYTEYNGNPIIDNQGQGKFSVTHVSGANVRWMPQYQKFFMYFHGENTTTRWAWSTDGLNWTITNDNVAITSGDFVAAGLGSGYTEASYARVFEYEIPQWGDRYTMVMMVNRNGTRSIALATSDDGKQFTPRDGALVSPGPDGQTNISGPFLWQDDGRHYILYHGGSNIFHTEVGANFTQEDHLGIFYDPASVGPEYNKAAEPFLHFEGGQWHMFYSVGPRLNQKIAYANESDPVPTPGLDIVIDNNSAGFESSANWNTSTSISGFWGSNYLADNSAGTNPGVWASWRPSFPATGTYHVYARWTSASNRPDAIKYRVYSQGQVTEVLKDQTQNGGSWQALGTYTFSAGSSNQNRVTLDAGSDSGYSIADAVRFVRVGP